MHNVINYLVLSMVLMVTLVSLSSFKLSLALSAKITFELFQSTFAFRCHVVSYECTSVCVSVCLCKSVCVCVFLCVAKSTLYIYIEREILYRINFKML